MPTDDGLGLPKLTSALARAELSTEVGLRQVRGKFATGVAVLTAGGQDGHGMTANSFTSVSLEPPLVLCCVSRSARMHEVINDAGSFAVSILAAEQRELCRYFSDRRRAAGAAQFAAVDWFSGPYTGAPLLSGAIAWLECRLAHGYPGGDHSIFVGRVLTAGYDEAGAPLLFFGGALQQLADRVA